MKLDLAAILSAFGVGGLVGSIVTLLVKDRLSRLADRRRRRVETDRATYSERVTRLIVANLCALIRSNRFRDGEREDLADLIQNLSDGDYRQRFLDSKVQSAWEELVRKSAECGYRRLADQITEQDIADYTRTWERWLLLARDSFGPLPESDRPLMRKRTAGLGEVEEAA